MTSNLLPTIMEQSEESMSCTSQADMEARLTTKEPGFTFLRPALCHASVVMTFSSKASTVTDMSFPYCCVTLARCMHAGKGFLADNTPWWNKYRDEFARMMSFGELETFDHPVACETLCLLPSDPPPQYRLGVLATMAQHSFPAVLLREQQAALWCLQSTEKVHVLRDDRRPMEHRNVDC